jgi:hypothetical protein
MLRKFFVIPALAVMLLPAVSFAQFETGDWEVTLSGSGGSDRDFNNNAFAAQGSLGYFMTPELEVGARQSISFVDPDGGSSNLAGATRIFLDYHFDLDRWQPFVGLSAGYVYGDGVRDDFVGGPEAGVKFFANNTTFIFASVGYDFALRRSMRDTGGWVYGLGIGFRI